VAGFIPSTKTTLPFAASEQLHKKIIEQRKGNVDSINVVLKNLFPIELSSN
jgi:hypothetical protein